jgi:hypothetical protein
MDAETIIRQHLSRLGSYGGKSRSKAKIRAARKNIAKARAARKLELKKAK